MNRQCGRLINLLRILTRGPAGRAVFLIATGILAGLIPATLTATPVATAASDADILIRKHPSELSTASPVIYEIRIPAVVSTVVKGYDLETNDILLPLQPIMEMLQLRYEVDFLRHTVTLHGKDLPLLGSQHTQSPDSVFFFMSNLARALNIGVSVNRSEAAIVLTEVRHLPVMMAVARAKAREALQRIDQDYYMDQINGTDNSGLSPFIIAPSTGFGALAIDYSFSQYRGARGAERSYYTVGAAMPFLNGTVMSRTYGTGTTARTDLQWIRSWPLDREPTQLRLGSVSATGPGGVPIVGLSVSNAPWSRAPEFNILDVAGVLPPEWSIEAYRDGALVGFDTVGSSGDYMLPIPVTYGDNSLKLIAYGPQGETMTFVQMIRARPGMLPKGSFEFAGSTGACMRSVCSFMMNLDLRYGVSPRWSVNWGATEYSWRGGASATVHPYAGVAGIVAPGLTVGATAMKGLFSNVSVSWDPSEDIYINAEHQQYSKGESGKLMSGGIRNQSWLTAVIKPKGIGVPIEVQGLRTQGISGVNTFLRVGTVIQTDHATLRPYVRSSIHSGSESRTFLGVDAIALAARLGAPRLSRWWMRSNVEISTKGRMEQGEIALSRGGAGGFTAEAGVRWNRLYSQPRFVLNLSRDLGGMRLSSTAIGSGDGNVNALQYTASGLVRWNKAKKGVSSSSRATLDDAGVAGVVYLDVNGNGKVDKGEPRIEGVAVTAGSYSAMTDKNGFFEVWGVAAGRLVTVRIDETTFESPWWVPARDFLRVPTAPGRSVDTQIPIVIGGALTGSYTTESNNSRTTFKVRHVESAREYDIDIYSDGSVYLMGMLAGMYDMLTPSIVPRSFVLSAGTMTSVDFREGVREGVAERVTDSLSQGLRYFGRELPEPAG